MITLLDPNAPDPNAEEATFKAPYKLPSAKSRKELANIDAKWAEEVTTANEQFKDVIEYLRTTPKEKKRMRQENPELSVRSRQADELMTEINDRRTLRVLRAAISTAGLTPEQITMVHSSADEDFYLTQNIVEAEQVSETFRDINNPGRLKDRGSEAVESDEPADDEDEDGDAAEEDGEADVPAPADAVE